MSKTWQSFWEGPRLCVYICVLVPRERSPYPPHARRQESVHIVVPHTSEDLVSYLAFYKGFRQR